MQSPAASGETIARRLGCAACHAGMPAFEVSALNAPALAPGTLPAQRVLDALQSARAGMPDFHLDDAEALSLALFLGQDPGTRESRRLRNDHGDADSAAGRRIFVALNCAGCHATPGIAPRPAGPALGGEGSRVRSEWLRAYLRAPYALRPFGADPGSGSRMPRFELSDADADSLAAWLLRGTLPLAEWAPDSLSAFEVVKQRDLMARRYACLGCHAIDGRGGRIGPDLALSGRRLRPAFLRAMLESPGHLVPGAVMPPTNAPAAALDRIASLIATFAGEPRADSVRAGYLSLVENVPLAASPDDNYVRLCAACHGAGGSGDGYNARFLNAVPANHADSTSMAARTDDRLYDAIAAGARFLDRSPEMPAFADVLTPDATGALVRRIRSLCRCAGPAWSRDGKRP